MLLSFSFCPPDLIHNLIIDNMTQSVKRVKDCAKCQRQAKRRKVTNAHTMGDEEAYGIANLY